jgi:hypothetical protein
VLDGQLVGLGHLTPLCKMASFWSGPLTHLCPLGQLLSWTLSPSVSGGQVDNPPLLDGPAGCSVPRGGHSPQFLSGYSPLKSENVVLAAFVLQ